MIHMLVVLVTMNQAPVDIKAPPKAFVGFILDNGD